MFVTRRTNGNTVSYRATKEKQTTSERGGERTFGPGTINFDRCALSFFSVAVSRFKNRRSCGRHSVTGIVTLGHVTRCTLPGNHGRVFRVKILFFHAVKPNSGRHRTAANLLTIKKCRELWTG